MICVSESPKNAPVGFALKVIAEVPAPISTCPDVNVAFPVPPPATGRVPYSTSVAPALTFSGCPAVPLVSGTYFVPLSFRILPSAGVVERIVLSSAKIVLFVSVRVSVVPTNSPVRLTRFLKESLLRPKSGIL
jgi:hypothetical protein